MRGLALEAIPGIRRYQLIQNDLERFVLRIEAGPAAPPGLAAAGRSAVCALVGPGAEVAVALETDLEPPPGRKFRVVQSRLGASPAPDAAAGAG